MTIKLNEFDKKLFANIKASDKWTKLKSIYAVNSIVKQLRIGNNKIGVKCAKHLQKLANKKETTIGELREGCKDLRVKKQPLPLTKSKEKRPVESVHKINKATDKAPTDKTKGGRKGGGGGGGGGGGRGGGGGGGGRGGGGGKGQPAADLVGGLLTAFKVQEATQARNTQYRELASQIPQGVAGDALRQRMQGPAAQVYFDALKEGSNITGLTEGERLLYLELKNRQILGHQAQLYNVSGQTQESESINLLNQLEQKIYAAREQDLTNVSLPPTPRSVFTASSQISDDTLTPRTISTVSSSSSSSMFNPTQEEKNQLAMDLLDQREIGISTIERSVDRKQNIFRERMKEANIYKEEQRESMIRNKIGIQTENYINKRRKEITDAVLKTKEKELKYPGNTMTHKEAQKKLRDLNVFYLEQLDLEQQNRVNQNIFDDIEEIERDKQFRLRNRKAGVNSVLSRLRNRESQEKQDRLVNDLIINQNEKKIQDIQSELLGVVSSRAIQKEKEQQNRVNQTIFNQRSQPQLGLTRTQSGDIIKQSDLQRTLSAPTVQSLDIGRAERKLREQQESEAIFNRKQQELASEVQELKRTDSLLERMERDAKRSLSEMSSDEFALPEQEPPVMAFGQEEKSLQQIIAEKQDLQKILAQIDAIEPMEDTMEEEIAKATKEVEEEKLDLPLFGISKSSATSNYTDKELFKKVRKVIDYKPLSTDTNNQIDNYINYSVNKYNEYRVNRPLYIETGVPEEIEEKMNLTFALKAYQLKKLGKEDLMLKELEDKGNFNINAHPDLVADMSENYYDVYARELEEIADRNAIFED